MPTFQPASRKKTRLRMAIDGPSGSGKTYTALRFAFALAGEGGKVAVIDTEFGSASKYTGEAPDGTPWEFDVVNLEKHSPDDYRRVIYEAGREGYTVLVIDSLTHAWAGTGGALEQVDKRSTGSLGKFGAWKDVTPKHNSMIEAILRSPCHVIATLRTKMEYVTDTDEKGKTIIRKVGLAPVQRQGIEYELDVVGDLDQEHNLAISKTRCSAIDGEVESKPGPEFIKPLIRWLGDGDDEPDGLYATDDPSPRRPNGDNRTPDQLYADAKAAIASADEKSLEKIAGHISRNRSTFTEFHLEDLQNEIGMRREELNNHQHEGATA